MHKQFNFVAKISAIAILIAAAPLAARGEANQRTEKVQSPPLGWTPVCIGRLVVTLPSSTEFAASRIGFDKPYAFDGIEDPQAWGEISWGGASLSETAPANSEGLRDVLSEAKGDLWTPDVFKKAIASSAKKLERWRSSRDEYKNSKEREDYFKETLAEKEQDHQELVIASRVTGVATSVSKYEFAIRPYTTAYSVGYWDQTDRRIRTFKGPLANLEPNSPEAAANQLRNLRHAYSPRLPMEIPSKPGFCSNFGFFDESSALDPGAKLKVPFRLQQYPNLLFFLSTEPASGKGPASILDVPDLAIGNAQLNTVGIKARHGADKVQILGSPGRIYAQEYGPNCASKNDCRPADQAYEIHAESFGQVGRIDRPHVMLYMVAATSDEYKSQRKAIPGNPKYNTPDRPALKGMVPPPYQVGRKIFDQVLSSIRVRPGAITERVSQIELKN